MSHRSMGWTAWHEVRSRIYARDIPFCVYCGRRLHDHSTGGPGYFTLDHVVPLASGGTSEDGNLVLSCRPCNSRKGDKPLLVYLAEP